MTSIVEKFSSRAKSMQGSEIRRLFAISMKPGMISFAGGLPDPGSFPSKKMAAVIADLLNERGEILLQYGPSRGTQEGIAAAIDRMRRRGIDVPPEQIIITSGGQQGIDLTSKVLIDPGDVILVENPTFIGALGAFRNVEASLVGVPMDDEGMIPAGLIKSIENVKKSSKKVKFLYTIPNFHNPAGITLSKNRRREILDIASSYDFFILEDDPYGELWFEGGLDSVCPLKALSGGDRVIYAGSFSKVISPGIRLGWAAAPPEMIERFDMAKQMMDVCPNPLIQAVAGELIRQGYLDEHIELLRGIYHSRCQAMLTALEKYMPDSVSWTKPKGGFYIWVTLPEGMSALTLFDTAVQNNVAYIIGSAFFADNSGKNTMRISFCHETEEIIEEGIQRLGKAVTEALEKKPR
ncbi:MAG: PLP-dependent aminotransferase family protein [Patescibacteria group bacterium]|nr:PLP-dependent aminotransferase family protein [Patescibacteria group bacterium]